MKNNFYAPGTNGYVYYEELDDGKIRAQWGGFRSSYHCYYFDNKDDMVRYYVGDEQKANFIIKNL